MLYAIFSDVHNNSAALGSVLVDAGYRGAEAFICLGDTGDDHCIRQVRNIGAEAVFGNWEVSYWRSLSGDNQRWVLNLPPMLKYERFWASHAAPAWPDQVSSLKAFMKVRHTLSASRVFPYYLREDAALWQAMAELMAAKVPVLFHGHTHQQMAWEVTPANHMVRRAPAAFSLAEAHYYVVGVGSVGQPKDTHFPSYVLFDSEAMQIKFLRLER